MAQLVAPLAFALGGEPFAPFFVNLEPMPDDLEVGAADPVRLSVRDVETFVVAGQLQVSVGYARARADGTELYGDAIDGAFLTSLLPGSTSFLDKADISVEVDGVRFVKTDAGAQRSVYAVGSALVPGDQAILATAVLRPDSISVVGQGAVFGVEHGFRNTAAYMFFTNPGGVPSIRITGPEDSNGARSPDLEITFDWSVTKRRYIILWNEIKSQVEFYVNNSGTTQLIHAEPIASFQEFDTTPTGTPTPRRGSSSDATLVWGIEGESGDQVTFENVAVATDVGFPIIGISRPGDFVTIRNSDEFVRFFAGDPRLFRVSSWFGPDSTILPNPDLAGVAAADRQGVFRLTKNTLNSTFAVYREEPGLLSSGTNGIMFEALFTADPQTVVDTRGTGMGFMLHDGQSIWQFNLFGGSIRSLGLMKLGGSPVNASTHFLPISGIDWLTDPVRVRVVIDPRRSVVEMFNLNTSDVTPILSTPFNRSAVPTADDVGLIGAPGFVAFGHLNQVATQGEFELRDLTYATKFQSWESREGLPEAGDPAWLRVGDGFNDLSPLSGLHLLGGGFGPTPLGYYVAGGGGPLGTQALENNQLVLTNEPGLLQVFTRGAAWDNQRGAVLETRLQITDHKPQSRSGIFLILDDGLKSYMLSFVDTPTGKFVGVPVRSGLNSFIEQVGNTGLPDTLSFKLDWSLPHTYRLERRRLDGLYLFVDNDPDPKLSLPDSLNIDYPNSQFLSPTVAWGQFSKEGSTSRWDFVRTAFSRGYEISFKKNQPDATLEDTIGNTQAVVVAFAEDDDA